MYILRDFSKKSFCGSEILKKCMCIYIYVYFIYKYIIYVIKKIKIEKN